MTDKPDGVGGSVFEDWINTNLDMGETEEERLAAQRARWNDAFKTLSKLARKGSKATAARAMLDLMYGAESKLEYLRFHLANLPRDAFKAQRLEVECDIIVQEEYLDALAADAAALARGGGA